MILEFDVGENKQVRSWVVRNGDTSTSPPIDLTNASTVQLIVASPFPTSPKTCSFVADATGTVSVSMLTADLATGGRYAFKTKITFVDGTVTDVPKPGFDYLEIGTAP